MLAARLTVSLTLLLVCTAGCNVSPDSPAGRENSATRRPIDWKVAEALCPHYENQGNETGLNIGAFPGYPEDWGTKKSIRESLIELGAYTDGGKLYDRSGREIRFHQLPSESPEPARGEKARRKELEAIERNEVIRKNLAIHYRVLVIVPPICKD